jgi:hypothetical protein
MQGPCERFVNECNALMAVAVQQASDHRKNLPLVQSTSVTVVLLIG